MGRTFALAADRKVTKAEKNAFASRGTGKGKMLAQGKRKTVAVGQKSARKVSSTGQELKRLVPSRYGGSS